MKSIVFVLVFSATFISQAQIVTTPDKIWGDLFTDVQLSKVLGDNKTFVDCTPKFAPATILKKYETEKRKSGFDLKAFVSDNFNVPVPPVVAVKKGLSLNAHLEELWEVLQRKADVSKPYSSLLPLPQPYIVPGGRFREIYYWDSYFTMQGLAVSNRYDLIQQMVSNFSFLITKYGHIPNGNRSYYMGRSQPPYFALMVDLLRDAKGNAIYNQHFAAMEKEYRWWMDGSTKVSTGKPYRRVVRLPDGAVLNRDWDDVDAPRQESYVQDVETRKDYKGNDGLVFRHLRAGAESGWDFSSRWFGDTLHLNTIETTNLIPVDLNALLYNCELILSKAAKSLGNSAKSVYYQAQAAKRKAAVQKYCWNSTLNYYFDYDFVQQHTTNRWSAAGILPLFTKLATSSQAAFVKEHIEEKFLKDGGIVTTLYHTGQQWDAPNGWAPLQYIAVKGLMNYGFDALAKTTADRWMAVNERVFASTGKMLEKYNVENITLESGGGEYPTQDGFGWSNGVYLAFYHLFKNQ